MNTGTAVFFMYAIYLGLTHGRSLLFGPITSVLGGAAGLLLSVYLADIFSFDSSATWIANLFFGVIGANLGIAVLSGLPSSLISIINSLFLNIFRDTISRTGILWGLFGILCGSFAGMVAGFQFLLFMGYHNDYYDFSVIESRLLTAVFIVLGARIGIALICLDYPVSSGVGGNDNENNSYNSYSDFDSQHRYRNSDYDYHRTPNSGAAQPQQQPRYNSNLKKLPYTKRRPEDAKYWAIYEDSAASEAEKQFAWRRITGGGG